MDIHTKSNYKKCPVRKMKFCFNVDIENEMQKSEVEYDFDDVGDFGELVLDSIGLNILSVKNLMGRNEWVDADFSVEKDVLRINTAKRYFWSTLRKVRVVFSSSTNTDGIQTLSSRQTQDKTHKFLYTQSQAILARTWYPCQDTPSIRVKWSAKVFVPKGYTALMSGERVHFDKNIDSGSQIYYYEMCNPVPNYLISLVVGGLTYNNISPRAGVWSEISNQKQCLSEFQNLETILETTEEVVGEYQWKKFDIVVMPPAFPVGGMENTMLTFVTPMCVSGDKSGAALTIHELVHSWSGNSTTMSTWGDLWLNEGLTSYLERKITVKVSGQEAANIQWIEGRDYLDSEIRGEGKLPDEEQILNLNLAGKHPDLAFTSIAYEKGALFFQWLEDIVGEDRLLKAVRKWFKTFQFQSVDHGIFEYFFLHQLHLEEYQEEQFYRWLEEPGLPDCAKSFKSSKIEDAKLQAKRLVDGESFDISKFNNFQYDAFLIECEKLDAKKAFEVLDKYNKQKMFNNKITKYYYVCLCATAEVDGLEDGFESVLSTLGRWWYSKNLYQKLYKTSKYKQFAKECFVRNKKNYHSVTIDAIMKIEGLAEDLN